MHWDYFFYLKEPHTLIKWSYKEKVTSIQSYYFQYLLYKFIKKNLPSTGMQIEMLVFDIIILVIYFGKNISMPSKNSELYSEDLFGFVK